MKSFFVISFILGVVLFSASSNGESLAVSGKGKPKGLSKAQFERALRNRSTAPDYILITVVDDNTGKRIDSCFEAWRLLSALCKERNLKWNEAVKFALEQEDRVFHFSNVKALQSVSREYNEDILIEAREFLGNMTIEEIVAVTRDQQSNFYKFCIRKPGQVVARFPAIAHVLSERGYLCTRCCKPGLFGIDRSTHDKKQKAAQ